jgi:hypothetical protein
MGMLRELADLTGLSAQVTAALADTYWGLSRGRDVEEDLRASPLLVFLDRPQIAGGEALAGLLRPGNAGSKTAADHITVLGWALESLPPAYRPDPADPGAHKILVRSDSAGPQMGSPPRAVRRGSGFPSAAVSRLACNRRSRASSSC